MHPITGSGFIICTVEGSFPCPHECGYVYTEEEGDDLMEKVCNSKNKSGCITVTTKCCKRKIGVTIGLTSIEVWGK